MPGFSTKTRGTEGGSTRQGARREARNLGTEEFNRTFLTLQQPISGEKRCDRAVEPARDEGNLWQQADAPAARGFVVPNEVATLAQPQQR